MDFAPVNEQTSRKQTLLPSMNTENITCYEFRGVFNIEEFYGIMFYMIFKRKSEVPRLWQKRNT